MGVERIDSPGRSAQGRHRNVFGPRGAKTKRGEQSLPLKIAISDFRN